MVLFKKKCELCKIKIEKNKEILAEVKVPALLGLHKKPFCSKKHAETYISCVQGTPRRNFCPTCTV